VTTLFFKKKKKKKKHTNESSQWHDYLSLSQHMVHAPYHVPDKLELHLTMEYNNQYAAEHKS